MTNLIKNRGLGRGLSSLLKDSNYNNDEKKIDYLQIKEIDLNDIIASVNQPRKTFDENGIIELAQSIEEQGLIQPILLKEIFEEKKYKIIVGERRYRAFKFLKRKTIPAIIKNFSEEKLMAVALVENIQRNQLNVLEEAEAYNQLIHKYQYTHEQLSKIIGKSRSHITNLLRLLTLPDEVKNMLLEEKLTMSHARSLVNKSDAASLANEILENKLSVRDIENTNRKSKSKQANFQNISSQNSDVLHLQETLSNQLGIKVDIKNYGENGKVILNYYNLQQFDYILQKLSI